MDARELCEQIGGFLRQHGDDPKLERAVEALRTADRELRATYSGSNDESSPERKPPSFPSEEAVRELRGSQSSARGRYSAPFERRRARGKATARKGT